MFLDAVAGRCDAQLRNQTFRCHCYLGIYLMADRLPDLSGNLLLYITPQGLHRKAEDLVQQLQDAVERYLDPVGPIVQFISKFVNCFFEQKVVQQQFEFLRLLR